MTSVSTVDGQAILDSYIASQAASATTTTTTTENDATSSLLGSYDTFLKILTTQLQNQDPTEPMDASEFTQQLVQYAEVEQQIATNDKLDSVLSALNSNGITPLITYVGAYVEATSGGELVVQSGQAMLAYTLPEEALSSTIYVKDDSGKTVATVSGATTKGLNRLVWDGKLDDGTSATDGSYKFSLVAKDNSGETMTVEDIRVIGLVTGIETESDGTVVLKAGELSLKDTDIQSVFASIGVKSGESSGEDDSETETTNSSDTTDETEETTS